MDSPNISIFINEIEFNENVDMRILDKITKKYPHIVISSICKSVNEKVFTYHCHKYIKGNLIIPQQPLFTSISGLYKDDVISNQLLTNINEYIIKTENYDIIVTTNIFVDGEMIKFISKKKKYDTEYYIENCEDNYSVIFNKYLEKYIDEHVK